MKSIEQRTMQHHLEWVLWERTLGTALPWRVGKSRQILRAEGGLRALPQEVMWVGAKKERESTSSCETLHKLWTRLLNNAWGGLVSARPTMPNSTKLRIKITVYARCGVFRLKPLKPLL